MSKAAEYRAKSIECLIEADRATDPQLGEQLAKLAMAYAKLVEILERNHKPRLGISTV